MEDRTLDGAFGARVCDRHDRSVMGKFDVRRRASRQYVDVFFKVVRFFDRRGIFGCHRRRFLPDYGVESMVQIRLSTGGDFGNFSKVLLPFSDNDQWQSVYFLRELFDLL